MLRTIQRALEQGIQILSAAGIEEAPLQARLLLESRLQCDRVYLILNKEQELPEEQHLQYLEMLEERVQGRPLQHILKVQAFMGLDFNVTPFTLIPRRETEELVELALERIPEKEKVFIMDVGTGTGCIPISIAVNRKNIQAIGIDLSGQALETAIMNSQLHQVMDRVSFVMSDLFENLDSKYLGTVDMIISNPPYIKTEEINKLTVEVKDFEPYMALHGGLDGLDFYRKICKDGKKFLKKEGQLLFEIGHDQREAVIKLLEDEGFLEILCKKDLSGMDRMICAKKSNID